MTLSLVGCTAVGKAVLPQLPPPLTEQQIVEMSQQKIPDEQIIKKIDETRAVYHLKSADVLRLVKAGVSLKVIDHMMETYTNDLLADQRRRLIFRGNDPYWQDNIPRSRYYP